jgi:HD-GYP domain-containing protein (c-di-GMP phosphodiesterase class II)
MGSGDSREARDEIVLEGRERTTGFLETVLDSLRFKDPYTFEHGGSVRALALPVGHAMELRHLDMWRLAEAAYFHDIGKVCIPSEILMKPGALTLEERAVMDRHPELGQQLLAEVAGYEEVGNIVRSCHENVDGTGYPDGLRGEDIPLQARIISVVDAFDALTTARAYSEPVSFAEARRLIASAAGSRFDVMVVEAFISALVEEEVG